MEKLFRKELGKRKTMCCFGKIYIYYTFDRYGNMIFKGSIDKYFNDAYYHKGVNGLFNKAQQLQK